MKPRLSLILALLLPVFLPTAAAQVTDSLEFSRAVYNSPALMIQGRVSGVRVSTSDSGPNSVINTNIRGLNTVRGTSEPLWIVDGVMLTSSAGQIMNAFWQESYKGFDFMSQLSQLDNLNLYDIESIEVLKNASATALYGSKGANGVIIIRTATPSVDKIRVRWNSNIGIEAAAEHNSHLRPGLSHNHSLSIGSNTGRAAYRLSAFYRSIDNPVPGLENHVGGLRINFDTKTNKIIWFGMNASASVGRQDSQTSAAWYGAPSMGIALRDLSLPGVINTVEGWAADYDDYALVFRGGGAAYVQVNFLPGLSWKTDASFDYQTNTRYFWFGTGTAFGNAFNNTSASSLASLFKYDMRSRLSYSRHFARHHRVGAWAGLEFTGDGNRFNTMNGSNYFTSVLRAKGYSLKESPELPRWSHRDFTSHAWAASLSYQFKETAGVEGMLRKDRTPRYDRDFTAYPAVSLWADLCKAFIPQNKAVSSLRIEAGWGKAGARTYVPYAVIGNFINPQWLAQTLQEKGLVINDDIQAFFDGYNRVLTEEIHAGLRTVFLAGRLEAAATLYKRETNDAISLYGFGKKGYDTIVWLPYKRYEVFGESSDILNKGIELEISSSIIRSKDWRWVVSANAAFNHNELLRVGPGDSCASAVSTAGLFVNRNIEGRQVSALYGVTTYNIDGTPNMGIIGNPFPKSFGGINSIASWRKISLEMQANWAAGFNIIDLNRMWVKRQTDISEQYLRQADYFRLSRLSLRYDLDFPRIKAVKSFSVMATATNLFTLTNYTGWNPEVNSFGSVSNMSVGIDYGSYPLARCFMLGIRVEL